MFIPTSVLFKILHCSIGLLIFSYSAFGQIDSKNLVGNWCIEKVTDAPTEAGQQETIQTQMMDEFRGVMMLFTIEGEYAVYLGELFGNDEFQDLARYEFSSRDSIIRIQYPNSDETIDYLVEKLTEIELVYVLEDEFGKHRFFMKRCD